MSEWANCRYNGEPARYRVIWNDDGTTSMDLIVYEDEERTDAKQQWRMDGLSVTDYRPGWMEENGILEVQEIDLGNDGLSKAVVWREHSSNGELEAKVINLTSPETGPRFAVDVYKSEAGVLHPNLFLDLWDEDNYKEVTFSSAEEAIAAAEEAIRKVQKEPTKL